MEEMNRSNRPGVGFTRALYHVVFSLYRIFCIKKPALTPVSEVPSRFELENKGFADLRLTTWLWHRNKNGAVDGTRTRDIHLGKVALYQLSYYRINVPWGGIEPPTL